MTDVNVNDITGCVLHTKRKKSSAAGSNASRCTMREEVQRARLLPVYIPTENERTMATTSVHIVTDDAMG